jgi:NAD(P)-dependent dehydrogenase (short-subunit alcohol dehydrogenase family)
MCFSWLKTNFTEKDIPDQSGKTFLITGGTSGLGFQSALTLYQKNAKVIITARDEEKGQKAIQKIQKIAAKSKGIIQFGILELSSLLSVDDFVTWFKALNLPLHVLLLNAGIAAVPFHAIYGLESQFFISVLLDSTITSTIKTISTF